MRSSVRLSCVLLAAVELLVAFTIEADASHKRHKAKGPPFGILIQVTINYHNSHTTMCAAYNENARAVTAYFDVYPSGSPGSPPNQHGTIGPVFLPVTTFTPLIVWQDGTPGISCTLKAPWPT
jgi:hypothetical protein